MSDEDADRTEHARATCPDCGMLNVIILDSPVKPTRMHCTNCCWDSLEADQR